MGLLKWLSKIFEGIFRWFITQALLFKPIIISQNSTGFHFHTWRPMLQHAKQMTQRNNVAPLGKKMGKRTTSPGKDHNLRVIAVLHTSCIICGSRRRETPIERSTSDEWMNQWMDTWSWELMKICADRLSWVNGAGLLEMVPKVQVAECILHQLEGTNRKIVGSSVKRCLIVMAKSPVITWCCPFKLYWK